VNHVPNARAISVIEDTRWGTYQPAKEIAAKLKGLDIVKGRVGLVGINATFGMGMPTSTLRPARLPEIEWIDVTRFCSLRVIKSEEEFDCGESLRDLR
jgi:hypothetical protein